VPLEKKRSVTLRTLLDKVGFGAADVDELSSIADRLSRIDKNLTATQRDTLTEVAGGKDLKAVVAELMVAVDPDRRQARAHQLAAEAHGSDDPTPEQIAEQLPAVLAEATATLQSLPKLRQTIVEVQQAHLQLLDEVSDDEVTYSGYDTDPAGKAEGVVGTWKGYIAEHRDDIDILQVMYGQRDRVAAVEGRETQPQTHGRGRCRLRHRPGGAQPRPHHATQPQRHRPRSARPSARRHRQVADRLGHR
jgi:type I restriction enzyme, R subunit